MSTYQSQPGDTPGIVAAKLGISVDQVMAQTGGFTVPGDKTQMNAGYTFTSDVNASSGTDTFTGDAGVRFVGLPGRPEIWYEEGTGRVYVVFFVPGIEPEVPMLWHVQNEEDLQSFFGPDQKFFYDRRGTAAQFAAAGALSFGEADEIVLRGENPYSGWVSQFEREREVMPFLNDPEVAAIMASAWMEGRQPTEAELASSDWFKSKTAGEQKWYSLLAAQPETAKQMMASNKVAVRRQLENAGVWEPPDSMVNYLAEKWTMGLWTDEQMNQQIALLADPLKGGQRDQGLMQALGGSTWDTTAENERYVAEEIRRWLGPVFGNWSAEQQATWAARIRNDPDGKDAFQNELARQRLAALPEYANESLTYEDIATPWRNLAFQTWGQNVDESSSMFQSILRANDAAVAGQTLRSEGLRQGVKQVQDDFLGDLNRSFGGGVRGYVR